LDDLLTGLKLPTSHRSTGMGRKRKTAASGSANTLTSQMPLFGTTAMMGALQGGALVNLVS
jgi:hypothetical protein